MSSRFASPFRNTRALVSMFAPLAVLVVACSGSTADSPADGGTDAASDASTTDAAAHDAASSDDSASDVSAPDAAGRACNLVVNVAPTIAIDFVATAPPAAQGGAIVDGTYTMTSATIYTGVGGNAGPTGLTAKVTIAISGATIQVASKTKPPDDHVTTTFTTSGSSFTATNTCPDVKSSGGEYTATATTFAVLLPAGTSDGGAARVLVETFTKQ